MEELKQRVCDVVSYRKNIEGVQTKIQVLTEMVAQVQSILISGENEGTDDVQHWLAEADEILIKANVIMEESNTVDNKRLCSSCWDPTSWWEIGDILRGIDRILQERDGLDLSSLISGPTYCKNLQSRENMLQEILEALMDIHVNMIGIYGMFGVGKSGLAKELARRAQSNQLFDATMMIKLSESLAVKLIQTQIANKIGLQLSDDDDEETRAHILYNELEKKVIESGQGNNIETLQQSKILVILDGIRHAIDLRKVGISHEQEGRTSCKAVLISRNADVCKEMGAEKNFLVDCLNLEEAKILFLEKLGDNLEEAKLLFLERENVMLVKCGGLPLMINSLACALRSVSLSNWEILADKLKRHTLLEVDEVKEVPCAILELCNNFIQIGGKHKLFLLCCLLIHEGDYVPLEKLMRYGIGFGLFEVGSSNTIVKQINSWVHELKPLLLLMEQHVKMHDLIQDIVISALSQGDHSLPVMLEAGTGWHTRESYENCVALSTTLDSNLECLTGLELPKLEAFVLKGGKLSFSPPDKIFQGMQNLKILDISWRQFPLPSSVGDLKNLVTLHLEYCELGGGDTSIICNLPRLEVLSLRGCKFGTSLPDEIGNLTNLRVLDLTACLFLSTFPVDAVAKLDQLTELYLYANNLKWSNDDMKKWAALPLEVFEIAIWGTSQLSPGALNFPNLLRFRIFYTDGVPYHVQMEDEEFNSYSSSLWIKGCGRVQFEQSGLQDLLQRTEYLQIKEVSGLRKGIGDLNVIHGDNGFSHLKSLHVDNCEGMVCMLDASNPSSIIDLQAVEIFPELQALTLRKLSDLTSLLCCPQPCYYSFFLKLRELRLVDMRQLSPYVLPVQHAVELRVMEVRNCESLFYVFSGASEFINGSGHGADISTVELPYLEKLKLTGLATLVALKDASIMGDELQILFDDKIKFSSLKEMHLKRLDQIQNLWDFLGSEVPYARSPCFGNLKDFTISYCDKLESVFPPRIVDSLSQLEKLQVISCYNMKEVITSSEVEDGTNPTTTINFPKLQTLALLSLSSLQCFCRGSLRLEFPKLRELQLDSLRGMKEFSIQNASSLQTQGTVLFDGEMDFPSLEHLQVSWMDIELLERHGETTRFPNLSRLILQALPNLKALPSINSKTLRFLDLYKIECFKGLSSKQLPTFPHSVSVIMSCELEELKLSNLLSLEELIDEEKSVDNRSEFDVKPHLSLRKLELRNLLQLKRIPWCMLTNLRSLFIDGLERLTCLISTSLLVGGHVLLPLLETIHTSFCKNLEAIISRERREDGDLVKYGITLFPSLRHIQLDGLEKLVSFSMGSYEAHFPSLETVEIRKCVRLRSFSLGLMRTPRLKHVKVGGRTIEADTFDGLDIVKLEATAEILKAKEAEMRSMAKEGEAEEAKTRAKAKRREAEEAKKIAKIKIIEAQEAQKIAEEKTREAKEAEMRADAKRREAKEAEMRSELPKRWEVDLAELRVENNRMEADEAQMRADTYK